MKRVEGRTPTLQAFIDYRNGDIIYPEYLEIILRRCRVVAERKNDKYGVRRAGQERGREGTNDR